MSQMEPQKKREEIERRLSRLEEEIHKLKQDVLNITTILMKKEIREPKNSSSGGTFKSEPDLHDNDWSH